MVAAMGKQTDRFPRLTPGTFSRAQLQRLLGISERQLSAWERQGWIRPALSGSDGSDSPRYGFSEIATIKNLLDLRQARLPASSLRRLQAALRTRLEKEGLDRSWTDLQIRSEGRRISVDFRGTRMEPLTGQLLLNYTSPPGAQVFSFKQERARRLQPSAAERELRAQRFFMAALRYEESPETIPKAIQAYRKAIQLNPRALGALINLGTLHYNRGEFQNAEQCYSAALALDPACALVHFNLGNLCEETGRLAEACGCYEEAVRLEPDYGDPRYNLALVYERLGKHGKACREWRAYLKLDSQSPWATYARQKLEQIPLRVVPLKTFPHNAH
jgi:tetratricopeptide (TPR) repeat protein